MKKTLAFVAVCITSFICLSDFASAEIIQRNSPLDIKILDFVLVNSYQSGSLLTRTFKLKVENSTKEPLYGVRFTLIHASDQITINEKDICLGIIYPGETIISDDDFTYSVDISKAKVIPEMDLHWSVEYQNSIQRMEEALTREIMN